MNEARKFWSEEQAYDQPYCRRVCQVFRVGDHVAVGPAYQGNGVYALDADCGEYVVVGTCGPTDYKLAKEAGSPWEVIVHSSRLVRR